MEVLLYSAANKAAINDLCGRFGLSIHPLAAEDEIPGSWFGPPEAGLIGSTLYIRPDTPVHSLLHEGCHYICMDAERRMNLDTNAGGDYDEENGVCYLQILLAGHIQGMGQDRMMQDMDCWGYTFRLGSAKAWFEQDAEDAQQWLQQHGLIDENDKPTWMCRS